MWEGREGPMGWARESWSARATRAYLLAYNAGCLAGWGAVLGVLGRHLRAGAPGGGAGLWRALEAPLALAQTAALAEVAHAALGLVRAPVGTTAVQVWSRVWLLWGVLKLAPAVAAAPLRLGRLGPFPDLGLGLPQAVPLQLGLESLVLAWALTEVLRYAFFAVKLAAEVPLLSPLLLWLRYSTFTVLYPLGIASELVLAGRAVGLMAKDPRLGARFSVALPNALNFGFCYRTFCILTAASYAYFGPLLYSRMLSQRRRKLGGAKSKAD